jgi:UDP-N-acetylglucosamine--N-acetylmuramyl-(pentapeptide) pyrophosphoryl-undecaprenol N-acetylglucosamine transferase
VVRVIVTGGGTGGHVYPGLAVAEVLKDQDPSSEIGFVGGHGLERQIVPQAGFPFRAVRSGQWPRRAGPRTVAAMAALGVGTAQSAWLLSRNRPDVVLATGGYASAPVGAAAGLLGIPLVLQEQNVIPGAANRFLARWARFVSVAHPGAAVRFGGAAVVTGVPVRRAALGGDRQRGLRRYGLDDGRLTILVLGGSLGAAALNAAVTGMATALAAPDDIQLLHQTGKDHLAWVEGQMASAPKALTYAAVAYIDDVADAYACADLVISRSGAGTMAEVTAHGLPVIAVPYPHGAEQDANARILEAAGAAVVITAPALSGARLADAVAALRDPRRRKAMAAASRALGRPTAAADVAALVWRAAGRPPANMAQVQ